MNPGDPPSPSESPSAAILLDPDDATDLRALDELRARPDIQVFDHGHQQHRNLEQLHPKPEPDLLTETRRWVYYPWRRALVSVLGPAGFRRVRLDRNRHLITEAEQRVLGRLRIGVVGLSVGHAIAYNLAAQGLCGELVLADFDELELTNLNRVPATLLDIGENKAIVAARRIAELDPYLPVRVAKEGVTPGSVDGFLAGLDLVIEECDSLDIKVLVREAARSRGIPVVMATSDRGLIDVERFDAEPSRPILHGLLGDANSAQLAGLSSLDKVPYILRFLDVANSSSRAAASMLEVGRTLSTWPQLAGEVALGATTVAEAVRRIGLGEPLPSGRVRVDVSGAFDQLEDPAATGPRGAARVRAPSDPSGGAVADLVAYAAARAPSGGNSQPWRIDAGRDSVTVSIAPERCATVDVGFRSSAVAVGSAMFNARVAAAAHHRLGPSEFVAGDASAPLRAVLRLESGTDPDLSRLHDAMLARETNRGVSDGRPIDPGAVGVLESVAARGQARLRLLTSRDEIALCATLLAAADRVRYLTPKLHAEMTAEIRWPGDPDPDSGIDVRSLDLDPGDLAALDILRRPEVMAHLAGWDAGTALGDHTRDRVLGSAAIGVLSVRGDSLLDYARGGMVAEEIWVEAGIAGLAVHPVTPLFLYARRPEELHALSGVHGDALVELQAAFSRLVGLTADDAPVIVFRFGYAPPTSLRSRRRIPGSPAGAPDDG